MLSKFVKQIRNLMCKHNVHTYSKWVSKKNILVATCKYCTQTKTHTGDTKFVYKYGKTDGSREPATMNITI